MPHLSAAAFQRVGEPDRAARTRLTDVPSAQQFARSQFDRRAGGPLHGQFGPASEVLTQVVDENTRLRLGDLYRSELLLHFHRRRGPGDQRKSGSRRHGGRCEGRAGEASLVPAGRFLPGVEIFAAVDIAERDRTGRRRPGGVADHSVLAAVGEFHLQAQDQLGRPERPRELGVAAAGGDIVHPVAQ